MIRDGRIVLLSLALATFITVADANSALACPNCKEAVSLLPGEQANMATGYNWSVVFMLVVPFSMMSTGALMVRRAVKNGVFPEL